MPRPSRFTWLLLFICLAVLLTGCNNGVTEKLCCQDDSHVQSGPDRQYCLNHTDAVRLWIQTPTDTSDQRVRLNAFKVAYVTIDGCATLACIEAALVADVSTDGLWDRYEDEHADAEDQLVRSNITLTDSRRVELVKCGFDHAIQIDIQ